MGLYAKDGAFSEDAFNESDIKSKTQKMKKLPPIYWGLVAVVLLAAAFLAYKTFGKPKGEELASSPDGAGAAGSGVAQGVQSPPIIPNTSTQIYARYGQRDEKVRALQSYLNTKAQSIAVDGIYGPNTQAAVQAVFGTSDVTVNQWENRS